MTRLTDAVWNDDLVKVAEYVTEGDDINKQDDQQSTPLAYAIRRNNLEMVRYLLTHGSTLESCFKESSALFVLIKNAINSYFHERDDRMILTGHICALLLLSGAALKRDDLLVLDVNLSSELRDKNDIAMCLGAEALLRANISYLIFFAQTHPLPSPQELSQYLHMAPRTISNIQLEAFNNVLCYLQEQNKISKESIEEYQNAIKPYHNRQIGYVPYSKHDANRMDVVEDKVANQSLQEVINKAMQPLTTMIQQQNQEMIALTQQITLMRNQLSQFSHLSLEEDKKVTMPGFFAKQT